MIALFLMALTQTPTQALTLLYVGDSHTTGTHSTPTQPSTSPGLRLEELILASNQFSLVATYGRCGDTTAQWMSGDPTTCGAHTHVGSLNQEVFSAPTPLLASLIKENNPDVIYVQLGTNMIRAFPDPSPNTQTDSAAATIQGVTWIENSANAFLKILTSANTSTHTTKCVWIGPPDGRAYANIREPIFRTRLSLVNKTLHRVVEPTCTYIDTSTFVQYPATGGNGIHYSQLDPKVGASLAGTWAQTVFNNLPTNATASAASH